MSKHDSEHGDSEVVVRAAHWNVHSWTDASGAPNLDAVIEFLADVEADVVSLVEVDEPDPAAPVLQQVAERAGYHSVFVPAFSYGEDDARNCFGNAILTRLPILAVRQHPLLRPEPAYDGTEPSEPRVLLLVLVQCSTRKVWFGSVHLPRRLTSAREAALAELRCVVAGLDRNWFLLGDFNTPSTSWLVDEPELKAYPAEAVPTYPADAPREAIDYAVALQGRFVESDVLKAAGSDHLPIVVHFRAS